MKHKTISTLFATSVAALALYMPMNAQETNAPAKPTATAPATSTLYKGLVDHNGKAVNADTFGGRLQLVFLGFTSCPVVCPTRIRDLNDALKKMKPEDAARVVITFVTIDPANDTPERMKAYIGDRKMIGLTGSAADIEAVKKIFDERGNTASHSGLTYLVSGDKVITAIPYNASNDRIASTTTGCLDMCGLPPARAVPDAPFIP